MDFDTTDIVLSLVKIALMMAIVLSITPVMVWVERRGSAFGFGFATDQTRALSIEFLGFDLVGPIHRLARVLDYGHYAGSLLGRRAARMARRVTASAGLGKYPSRTRAGHIAAVDRFDGRFDGVADGLTPARIMAVRDAAYLNWRYVDCPTVEYGRYSARTEAGVRGFVVFHAYEADGVVRGIIDELVCSPDDPDTMEHLVTAALSDLADAGAVNAVCWLPDWHPLADRLRALGFRDREARTELIVFRGRSTGPELEPLTEERHWYYTHGDSDFHVSSA